MTMPSKSTTLAPRGVLAARSVRKLVDELNQGVIDDHVITAKLDADGGVTDVDYEAQLTALEVEYEGYTPTEASVVGLFGAFSDPGHHISEELMEEVVRQMNARITDYNTIAAKLDADATVNFAVYEEAAGEALHVLGIRAAALDRVESMARTPNGTILIGTSGAGVADVQISRDDGRTFEVVFSPGTSDEFSAVAAVDDELFLAASEESGGGAATMYRSEDGGRTWEAVDTDVFDGYDGFRKLLVASDGAIYATSDSDAPVWKSTDKGLTWTLLDNLNGNGETEARAIAEAADGSIVVAASESGGDGVWFYRSTDGTTFTQVDTFATTLLSHAGFRTAAGTLLFGSYKAATNTRIHRSTDDGATFSDIDTGVSADIIHAFVQGPSGRIYALNSGAAGPLYSDDDGATWTAIAHAAPLAGLGYSDIKCGVVTRKGDIVAGTIAASPQILLIADQPPVTVPAYGETGAGPGSWPQLGGGLSGSLLDSLIERHNRLAVCWHSVCLLLDDDSGVTDANYEAQLAVETLPREPRAAQIRPDA